MIRRYGWFAGFACTIIALMLMHFFPDYTLPLRPIHVAIGLFGLTFLVLSFTDGLHAGKLEGDADPCDALKKQRNLIVSLKDFAIQHGLNIDNHLILDVDKFIRDFGTESSNNSSMFANSDMCIRDLTKIVYPVKLYRRYRWVLIAAGCIGIAAAIVSFNQPLLGFKTAPILAASLGLLGAVVYGLFVDIGAVTQEQFDKRDEYSGYARLVLGALLGFVLYFAFSQRAFDATGQAGASQQEEGPERALFLLLPFIAGYSTLLVVNLLGRLTKAVEVTLGLNHNGNLQKRLDVLEQTVSSKSEPTPYQKADALSRVRDVAAAHVTSLEAELNATKAPKKVEEAKSSPDPTELDKLTKNIERLEGKDGKGGELGKARQDLADADKALAEALKTLGKEQNK